MKKPLTCEIKDGQLVISIGISTLCFAAKNNEAMEGIGIISEEEFAKDIINELEQEQEDGTTPVHLMFDAAIEEAINNGSTAVTYPED